MAGLHPECVPWLRERDVAVLGCDGVSDVFPGVPIEGWSMPIHQFTVAPLRVERGTGSPCNPIAVL